MDQAQRYRSVIKAYLLEIARLANAQRDPAKGDVTTECIFDETRDHYILMDVGWVGEHRVRNMGIYARLRAGKVWIEYDMTEEGLGNVLLERGVPREDIVLAFQSPRLRQLAELATA